MIDETNNSTTAGARAGFCQDCGRALTAETIRKVGSGVFCEPCLQVRTASGTVPPVAGGPVRPPASGFPPVGGSDPSPALAAILGFIPGVGAMYNGQFAKGIAHFVIFAFLEMLTNAYHNFSVLIVGWVFYQVFEAYYTAKARREGTPLPDPLGLNNIGTHVGMHMREEAARRAAQNPGQPTSYPGWTGFVPPQPAGTAPPPPVAGPWASAPVPPPVSPYGTPYEAPPVAPAAAWGTPVQQPWGTPVADGSGVSPVAVRRNNIPAAAAWLIGLGLVFTVFNLMPEWRFSLHKAFPFLLMVFAVWIFLRRMWLSGGLGPFDGEGEGYAVRVAGYLRAPVVTFTVGVLWMLQEFDVARFGHTWSILLIVLGVVLLIERSVGGRLVPAPMQTIPEEKVI